MDIQSIIILILIALLFLSNWLNLSARAKSDKFWSDRVEKEKQEKDKQVNQLFDRLMAEDFREYKIDYNSKEKEKEENQQEPEEELIPADQMTEKDWEKLGQK